MGKSRHTAPPPERQISRREADLLRHVMADVAPLPGREVALPAAEAPVEPPPPRPAPPVARSRPTPPAPPPVPRLPEIGPGDRVGVDKRTAKRLKRGQLAVEARMDLHGLTQEEAHRALSTFVQGSQAAGRRCVLVITGKGLRPDGTTGVLRAAVPHWLNQPDLRERIVAFTHATPRDGGEGALYLLLKRKR
ncbi:MAG: Smr/MutS family protein [Alphaproteobacteria bacterium]|nr:Smr/MutS family protein [Alphaproteobacteria bacterium]